MGSVSDCSSSSEWSVCEPAGFLNRVYLIKAINFLKLLLKTICGVWNDHNEIPEIQ